MELVHTFTVPVPVDQAWLLLLDVARLAPCLPGATVDEVQGDDVLGRVRVKLGPITTVYQGRLTFAEKDEEQRRVVMDAAGRETRGSGTASARITALLSPGDQETHVSVTTDLAITGKPAQFGRGIMADVSERILGQFAANLARELAAGRLEEPGGVLAQASPVLAGPASSGPAQSGSGLAGPPPATAAEPEPLDLGGALGGPLLRRLAPVLIALAALTGLAIIFRARGRRAR